MFREKEIITAAAKVHAIAGDGTLRCGAQASNSVGPDFERLKFQGAGRRLAAAEQPRAGSVLEPSRPEMANDTIQISHFSVGREILGLRRA
jgi:hypothetical protein